MKRLIIAGLFALIAVVLSVLAWHEPAALLAMGKRTEGLCPPFCNPMNQLIASGRRTEGLCPPFCERFWMNDPANQVIAQRNQALTEVKYHSVIPNSRTE
jgi:hypothetical protein